MESNARKAKSICDAVAGVLASSAKEAVSESQLADLIAEALDARDALWKRAIGEVLKDNPATAQDFLEALGKTAKALRETLSH